jgi:hypothetical protein
LRQLLQDLHLPVKTTTVVYCDNVSAIYMSSNPVQHRRMKHIENDIHFVREKVVLGEVRVLHAPSSHVFADIMTKGLPSALFDEFQRSAGFRRGGGGVRLCIEDIVPCIEGPYIFVACHLYTPCNHAPPCHVYIIRQPMGSRVANSLHHPLQP